MTTPVSPNTPLPSFIDDKIHFIRLRRKGYSFDAILQNSVEKHQQDLITKTAEIASTLFKRQNDVEKAIEELTLEAKSIDFLEAGKLQCDNLTQAVQELQEVNLLLNKKLAKGETDLADLQKQKVAFQAALTKFKQTLSAAKSKNNHFQDPLYRCGENLSLTIAKT